MRSKKTLCILVLPFLLFLCNSVKGSGWERVRPYKYIDSNLTQVIEDGWDKNLFTINESFPFGSLARGNIKKRYTADYFVGLNLKDVNRKVSVRFYQDEKSLQGNETVIPALRKMFILCESNYELEEAHKQIRNFIKEHYSNFWPIIQTSNPTKFIITNFNHFHDNGRISIELQKGNGKFENELVLNIQYTRVWPLSPEEAREILEMRKEI